MVRSASGVGQEDAPPVVGHLHVVEVGPALLADRDGGAEVDVVVLVGDRAHLLPPVEELRLPALEGPLQPAVVGQPDVVGDLVAGVDGQLIGSTPSLGRRRAGTRCRSGAGLLRRPSHWVAGRSSSARPTAGRRSWSRWSPVPRTAATPPCPVRASGREGGPLLEGQPDLVVPVEVVGGEGHQAQVEAVGGEQLLAERGAGGVQAVGVTPEAGGQAAEAVGHGQRPVVDVGEDQGRRRPGPSVLVAFDDWPSRMRDRSAARASSASGAGEAAARFDQGDQAAGRHVEPLEGALPVRPDLADQPVAVVLGHGWLRRRGRRPGRPRW